jgi:hypothetical protein
MRKRMGKAKVFIRGFPTTLVLEIIDRGILGNDAEASDSRIIKFLE